MTVQTSPVRIQGPSEAVASVLDQSIPDIDHHSRSPVPGRQQRPSAFAAPITSSLSPQNPEKPVNKKRTVSRPIVARSRPAPKHVLTPAEEYANIHSKRDASAGRDKEAATSRGANLNDHAAGKKPIFEWISRKLGGKRNDGHDSLPTTPRGTNGTTMPSTGHPGPSSIPVTPRDRMVSLPITTSPTEYPPRQRKESHSPIKTSAGNPFPPLSRDHSSRLTHESVSLRVYPHSLADSEKMRIREANNPYPSIPVPPPPRDLTLDSQSMSFLSRSRSPSLRSDASASVRPRISMADDSSIRWSGADEDASIRPFPPSHPGSPTPSTSVISRSASRSLLSPGRAASLGGTSSLYRPPSPPLSSTHRPETQYTASTNSSERDMIGRHSRRDSASTKPTTVMSIDSGPHPAHIAQVPVVQPPQHHLGHSALSSPLRQAFDVSARNAQSRDSSPSPVAGPSTSEIRGSETPTSTRGSPLSPSPSKLTPPAVTYVQAPKHSQPHPRDNPLPLSAPEPNASTLTLASSTFAVAPLSPNLPISGPASVRLREVSTASVPIIPPPPLTGGISRTTALATSPSVTFAPEPPSERPSSVIDSGPPSTHALSLYGHTPSMSLRTGGWHSGRVADGDASVRAVRRKGSWESNESRWSWRGGRGLQPQSQAPLLAPAQGRDDLAGIPPGIVGIEVKDDDSSSKRSRPLDESALLRPIAHEGYWQERPLSARDSVMTRDSFVTARSVFTPEGREIGDGLRGIDLDGAEAVAAR